MHVARELPWTCKHLPRHTAREVTFLSDFADQAVVLPVIAVIAITLAAQGWRRGALIWLGVVIITFGLLVSLKLAFLACGHLLPLRPSVISPSGHVASAAVVAGGLTALLTRRYKGVLPVAGLTAGLIGLSRLMLGMHSVPEVIIGALVGLAGAAALPSLAKPPPSLRTARLFAVVLLVAASFHGMHLPAEAALRYTASRASRLFTVCRASPHQDWRTSGEAPRISSPEP